MAQINTNNTHREREKDIHSTQFSELILKEIPKLYALRYFQPFIWQSPPMTSDLTVVYPQNASSEIYCIVCEYAKQTDKQTHNERFYTATCNKTRHHRHQEHV